jgi:uncharacterized protein YndB with AHSA1/START domain
MSYQVKMEKMIGRPAPEVFRALSEGRLFINCSADSNSIQMNFRVGGSYRVEFKNHKVANWGEFIEIVPDKKIVFTWCQHFGEDQKPDTTVTIELFAVGDKTRMAILHTGFTDKENCDGHYQGWEGGIDDLNEELSNGRVRMLRRYDASTEKLFETVLQTVKSDMKGECTEVLPNKKIVLALKGSRVVMNILPRDKGTSALELLHEGLMTKEDQMSQRRGWDIITSKMTEKLEKSAH